MILPYVDLLTLTDIRSTNSRVRAIVDSLPDYKTLVHHVPELVPTALSYHFAHRV